MTEAQTPFIDRLASHIGAEVATDLPEAGGYSQVSWDATKAKDGPALVSTIATAVLEKKPGVKCVFCSAGNMTSTPTITPCTGFCSGERSFTRSVRKAGH